MSVFGTILTEARAIHPNPVDNNNWRFTQYGIMDALNEMSYVGVGESKTPNPAGILNPDIITKAENSQGIPLKIPALRHGNLTVKNVRSCTIDPYENSSTLLTVVWKTYVVDISMLPGQYKNNSIQYAVDFARKVQLAEETLAFAIESDTYAALEANKATVNNSPLVGTKYAFTGGNIQATLAQQNLFFNDVPAIMKKDNFFKMPYWVIGSTELEPNIRNYFNQGSGNSQNTNFQFDQQSFRFRFSNQLPASAGKAASGFILQGDQIGIISRNAVDELGNYKTTNGTEFSTEFFEKLRMRVGVQYKSDCTDATVLDANLTHLKATVFEHWQISVDVAYVLQDQNTSGIKKFDYATT